MPKWLSESIEDASLVKKALKNLNNLLESEDERVSADMTKFTLTRLNKKKFSERQEIDHTTKGEAITGFNFLDEANNKTNEETEHSVEETTG